MRHAAPVAPSRHLGVPDLGRDAGLARDAERLVERLVDLTALVAHVGRIDAAVAPGRLRERDDLFGGCVDRGGILERRGDAHRTLLHGGIHERNHAGQLLRCRRAILLAHHGEAHLCGTDERRDVDRAAGAREVREVAIQIAPIFLHAVLLHPHGVVRDEEVREWCDRAAFPGDLGRDALADLAEHPIVDQHEPLGLAEHVDESGSNHQAGHVDCVARLRAAEVSDRGDAVAADGHITGVSRIPAAVDDPAALEDHIVGSIGSGGRAHAARGDTEQEEQAEVLSHFHVDLRESGRIIRPRIMTIAMLRVAPMPPAGLALRTTRSATLPWAIMPSESACSSCAPRRVAAVIASSGVRPAATSKDISSCREYPGISSWFAASEPAAIAPPARLYSRTNWSCRRRERRKASKSAARQPVRRSRLGTLRTLCALSGTSSLLGRVSRMGLSRRASMSCTTSVATIVTLVYAKARAVRATAAESSPAQPFSSAVHPARKLSCALAYFGSPVAACTTPDICSIEPTPSSAAVSASVFPRCAATGSRSLSASSSRGRSSAGVTFA